MSQETIDAFVLAAMRGELPAVKRLAKQVKDVNAVHTLGASAIDQAALYGHLPVVQCEARADVDRQQLRTGCSALHTASQKGKVEVAQFLIEAGADLDATSLTGATALFVCAQVDQAAAARVLIYSSHSSSGRPLSSPTTDLRVNLSLTFFIRQIYHHLLVLIKAHANVNLARPDGATPLYVGAQQGSMAVMRLLLAAGADVEQANKKGALPMTISAHCGQTTSVRLLLGAGASVNARGYLSCTALYSASLHGHVACVRLLLCYGRADMSLIGGAPNNRLARDDFYLVPEANTANAPAIRAHFDTAERWEREREAAMRDGVVARSRRCTLRPLRRIYCAIPEHLLSYH